MRADMDGEKREAPRLDTLGQLTGEVSVLAPIVVYDLSALGARLECAFPLVLGSAHEIRLHLGPDAVVVRARVVHCQIAEIGHELVRYVAGVEFLERPPHVDAALRAYAARLGRGRTTGAP
ncbi:MAG TPA: PilZ domain-containing protein [Vicinamibacterales bacterium]|nr:PilZ domain-containing protein [Vicinamibacterales bacterium]HOG30327.1 PilZ domain-containing protein [Vicinamibacterales bacterium]HPW21537.1 PilZ domain-containing protein [Vicinamibacterales bacterium]